MEDDGIIKYERDYKRENDSDRKNYIGKTFSSNQNGDYKVIGVYANNNPKRKLYICEFIKTGFQNVTSSGHIRDGQIRDRHFPSIYGIGFLGSRSDAKEKHKENSRWKSMLNRIYVQDAKAYREASVCSRWHNFSLYLDDMEKMLGYKEMVSNQGVLYVVDKDILYHGNKLYSAETCCFVPYKLNQFYANVRCTNTSGYEGVKPSCDGVPNATIEFEGKSKYLGRRDTFEECYEIYSDTRMEILDSYFKEGGEFEYVDKIIQDACYKKQKIQYNEAMIRNGREDEVIPID